MPSASRRPTIAAMSVLSRTRGDAGSDGGRAGSTTVRRFAPLFDEKASIVAYVWRSVTIRPCSAWSSCSSPDVRDVSAVRRAICAWVSSICAWIAARSASMNCWTCVSRPAMAGDAAIISAASELASVAARVGSPSSTIRWTRIDSRGASADTRLRNSSSGTATPFLAMTCSSSGLVVARSAYVWDRRWLARSWLRSGFVACVLWPTMSVTRPS